MDESKTVAALSALAQPTRLQAFRLLVENEPEGVPAGELARVVGVPQNTLSTHLAILANAGLVTSDRQGRMVIYRADLERFRDMTLYLIKDCCGGNPDLCGPLIKELTPCCPPKQTARTRRSENEALT